MRVTPEILREAYRFFLYTPPFSRYKLPPADGVEFRSVCKSDRRGQFRSWGREPNIHYEIGVTDRFCEHLNIMLEIVAHEMVHLIIDIHYPKERGEHGVNFQRVAQKTAKYFGYDPKAF